VKILWLPHTSWDSDRSRDQYFISELKKDHEIHVLTWTQPKGPKINYFLNPKLHIEGFNYWDKKKDGVYLYHYQRFHNVSFTPNLLKINEKKFQKKIKEIVKEKNIDVIICGPSHYINGFPPFDIDIPIIFDYLDYLDDKNIRDVYLKKSDAVLCVSHNLLDYSCSYNKNSYYLPNAINFSTLLKGNADKVRDMYELYDSTILTLIGLTTADSYYLIDTFPIVKKKIKDIKYLIVGNNHHYSKMKKKAEKYKDIVFTNWVDNIEDFFSATDIGTYPVNKTVYDDCRCPIKILEYTALGKPVVSTNIDEVVYWNYPNIYLSEPNAKSFSENIIKSFNKNIKPPNLNEFKIENLSKKLIKIIEEI
jgi:glycosyltransferase involved in cell wall biosynthesis